MGAEIIENQSEQNSVGSEYDSLHGQTFFARGTAPPIASPAISILVRPGRLAKWIARHSSFQFRSGTL